MSKICTDINQSKKLLELGIDVNTADMSYRPYEEDGISGYLVTLCPHRFASWIGIPCWSLAALRDCLPSGISIDGILYVFESHNTFDNEWVYVYKYEDSMPIYFKSKHEIDACYEMTVWLKENEKI